MDFAIACTGQQFWLILGVSRPRISCNLGTRLQLYERMCGILDVYLMILILSFQTLQLLRLGKRHKNALSIVLQYYDVIHSVEY